MRTPDLIENTALVLVDIPDVDVMRLDPDGFTTFDGPSAREWERLWEFALTFDGHRYFGGDDGAEDRLGAFASSISAAFRQKHNLPKIDLAMLRASLFFEQRLWNKHSVEYSCPPETARYLEALLGAIRRELT